MYSGETKTLYAVNSPNRRPKQYPLGQRRSPQSKPSSLFFVDGDGYMIAVMSPLDYTSVLHIKNRKTRGALLWKILAKIDQ